MTHLFLKLNPMAPLTNCVQTWTRQESIAPNDTNPYKNGSRRVEKQWVCFLQSWYHCFTTQGIKYQSLTVPLTCCLVSILLRAHSSSKVLEPSAPNLLVLVCLSSLKITGHVFLSGLWRLTNLGLDITHKYKVRYVLRVIVEIRGCKGTALSVNEIQ